LTGIQLVAIGFAAVMAFFTYTAWRRNELDSRESLLWMAVWVALVLISLFPDRLRAVIAPLQVARLLDLVMVGGILFLAALVFHLNRVLRRLEAKLVQLVRALALEEESKH
jgi:hypothetical protein